jgi:hypothetical protein
MKSGAERYVNIINEHYLRKKGVERGKIGFREFLGIKPRDVVVSEVIERFLKIYKRFMGKALESSDEYIFKK